METDRQPAGTGDAPRETGESDEQQHGGNAEEKDVEPPEPSPGEVFTRRLLILLSTFSNRQSEVLRMSEYFDERDAELNDAKLRAKRLVRRELAEVDESVLDRYFRIFKVLDEADETEAAERKAALSEALAEVAQDLPDGAEQTYTNAVLRSLRRSLGARFLHSSLLTILVSELEMFINQLARACFEIRPAALGGEKALKWSDISGFVTVNEVRDHLVDETIEDLLHGSMLDWIEFFENRFGISEVKAARSFTASEVVQRRHCVAHNAGLASRQYLDKLARFDLPVEVNDPLDVDSTYLARAADALMLVAYSLVWALGVKLNPEKKPRQQLLTHLTNRTMFLLQEQRYELVRQIVDGAPLSSMKGDDEYSSLVLQVNGWIAAKELGQFESVRAQVEHFPVATRDNTFKLAKLALLDQNEEGLDLAQRMLRDDELKPGYLLTWPLLRGIRHLYRAREMAEKTEISATVDTKREEQPL